MMNTNRLAVLALSILLVLLLASVALNWVLFQRGRGYYLELNSTRLDPLGLDFYSNQSLGPPESERVRVVFFGDSRAYEWPAPEGLDGIEFVNRGVVTQTSAQALGRFKDDVGTLTPGIVIVQVGINDLKTIPLFPQRTDAIVAECEENIEEIVVASRNLGAQVILTTIFPLGKVPLERQLFWSEDVGEAIREVNDRIRSLNGEGVIVFDTAAILEDEPGQVRGEYSRDLLHLREAGYEALNEELAIVLAELAGRRR